MNRIGFLRTIVLLLLSFSLAASAAPKVRATISSATIAVGESVDLEISVEGSVRAEEPAPPQIDGLEFRGTSQSSQMSIIGAEVTQRVTYTMRYTARKEGKFTFPALDVSVGGQQVKTEPIALTVKPGTPAKAAGDVAFMVIEPLETTAYVGQDIGVYIRGYFDLSTRWNLGNKPQLVADGFNTRDILPGNQGEQELNGKRYGTMIFRTVVTPTKAGKLKLGEAKLRAQYSRERRNPYDPFGGFGRVEEMELTAPAIEIDVKPLPVDGRPAMFAGAIGQFETFTGSGTPAKVKVGEPITMTLTIAGRGNFDRITTPPLASADGWNAYDSEEQFTPKDDLRVTGTKSFRLPVAPLVNKTAMPVFEFSFFNPETGKYVTLKTDPAPLTVEGVPLAAPAPAPDAGTQPAPAAEAKPDLLPNLPAPGNIVRFPKDSTPTLLFGMILAPLPILLGVMAWRSRRADPLAGPLAALKRERGELASRLRRIESRDEFFSAVGRVLQLDTAVVRREPSLSFDDAAILDSRELSESDRAALEVFFATRAELLFAGGGADEKLKQGERDRVLDALAGWDRGRPIVRRPAMAALARCIIALGLAGGSVVASDFEDANAAFAAGKFEDARRGYERVLGDGWQAGALFNLGNTYFRVENPGRAVLNYERALALSPAHPDARANLKYVREKSGAKTPVPAWYEVALDAVPTAAAPWLAIGVAWLGWLWAGASLLRRSGAGGVIGGSLLVLIAAGYGGVLLWQAERRALDAIVLEAGDAHREPADRAPLTETLPAGSKVSIVSEHGAWTFARLPGGQSGWLKSSALERVKPTANR